jgi:hypothetical protein
VARAVNDSVSDEERQQLWPLILASLDTARRWHPIFDWRVHRFAERILRRSGPTIETWHAVLVRFTELSGFDASRIASVELRELEAMLRRPFVPGGRVGQPEG